MRTKPLDIAAVTTDTSAFQRWRYADSPTSAVAHVQPAARRVAVQRDAQNQLCVASVGHKAQGATVDRAYVLGSDLLYREWGYVALSRAREGTHLYTVAADLPEATRTLAADLADSRAQQLASDLQPTRPLWSAALEARAEELQAAWEHARRDAAVAQQQLDDLHRERDALGPLRRLAGADRRLNALILEAAGDLDDARARMAAAQDEARELARQHRALEQTVERQMPAPVERREPELPERSLGDDFGLAL